MHKRKMGYLGGISLLFLLLCSIVGCIQHPDTISTEDTISCTEIIDGDTFKLANGDTVRLLLLPGVDLFVSTPYLCEEHIPFLGNYFRQS